MLVKTILYENGIQTVVVFDTEKPLWSQEVRVVEQPQNGSLQPVKTILSPE